MARNWTDPPPLDVGSSGGTDATGSQVTPSRYLVNHLETLDLDQAGINCLRPPLVIDGFIRQGGVMLLGAESKTRKSWMAQDAALCVADGTQWLTDEDNKNGFDTVKARAHVFDLELDEGEMLFRFAKTRSARYPNRADAERVTKDFFHYCLDGLSSTEAMAVIESLLTKIKAGDIVVIDCFYRLCADSCDPNDVAFIFEQVKKWAKQTRAAWVIIDHFRKAGADKARDRFNGSFIKQAGPGCLVAIEARRAGVLELQIDARAFYGEPRVWCRWDDLGYRFVRIPEADVVAAKEGADLAKMVEWLIAVWNAREATAPVAAKDAATIWTITDQAARDRIRKLETAKLVEVISSRPMTVKLAERGLKHVKPQTGKP